MDNFLLVFSDFSFATPVLQLLKWVVLIKDGDNFADMKENTDIVNWAWMQNLQSLKNGHRM